MHPAEGGFIQITRESLSKDLLQRPEVLAVYVYLLRECRFFANKALIAGVWRELRPGQLAVTEEKLASELKFKRHTVRAALKLLNKMGLLTRESTTKESVFTLLKYRISAGGSLNSAQQAAKEMPDERQRYARTSVKSLGGDRKSGLQEGQNGKREYPSLGGNLQRSLTADPLLLRLTLQAYYKVWDPRHPAYSVRLAKENQSLKDRWEAEHGSWMPEPKHPEDHREDM